jgi:hypothetical protein
MNAINVVIHLPCYLYCPCLCCHSFTLLFVLSMFMLSFIDPAICTVHVYVVIHFYDSMWSFWVKANLCRFFIICLYMYRCWRSSYNERRVGIPLSCLTPLHFCACQWSAYLNYERWLSIPSISTKRTITSHLNWTHWTEIKTTTYDVGNPGPGLGQAQKCSGVKQWSLANRFYLPI